LSFKVESTSINYISIT